MDSEELSSVQYSAQIAALKIEQEQKKQKLVKLLEQYSAASEKILVIKKLESKNGELEKQVQSKKAEYKTILDKIKVIKDQQEEIKNAGFVLSIKLSFGILSEEKLQKDKESLQLAGKGIKNELDNIIREMDTISQELAPLKEREGRFEQIISTVKEKGGKKGIEKEIEKETAVDEKEFLKNKSFIGTTLAKVVMNNLFWELQYDVLLIDEGSMADLAFLVSLSTLIKEKIVIIGDPQQLAPIADQDDILRKDLFMFASNVENVAGLFEWNSKNPSFTVFLDTQYRMPAKLGNIVSKIIYNGKLKNRRRNRELRGGFSAKNGLWRRY